MKERAMVQSAAVAVEALAEVVQADPHIQRGMAAGWAQGSAPRASALLKRLSASSASPPSSRTQL